MRTRSGHAALTRLFVMVMVGAFSGLALRAGAVSESVPSQSGATAVQRHANCMLQSKPTVFVENQGQWADASVRFALSCGGASVGLTGSGLRFLLIQRENDELGGAAPGLHEFQACFEGASPVQPIGQARASQRVHFRRGEWADCRENAPAYDAVSYPELYPGVELRVMGRPGGVKYEFHVAPGADWTRIRMRYEGITGLRLRGNGDLEITPAPGWAPLTDSAPVIWQGTGAARRFVPGRFQLLDERTVDFEITGDYDKTRPLVIDPDLAWSTYLGGTSSDYGRSLAIDGAGAVYVTGETYSSGWTAGGFDTSFNSTSSSCDAFVAKLSPTGEHLWSAYLGGSAADLGRGVAVTGDGDVIVTGSSSSAGWVTGGYDTTHNGGADAFLVKLSATGEHLWSTYLGGAADDSGKGLASDGAGNLYLTGETYSSGWTSGGFDATFNSGSASYSDAFVAKLSPAGEHLWSTYLGGAYDERGVDIAADRQGDLIVAGFTSSPGWVAGGVNETYGGSGDIFVARLSSAGGHLWSSYQGGNDPDTPTGMTLDSAGNICIAGATYSPRWASGGYDTVFSGSRDAFALKLAPNGSPLWSTYLGDYGYDYGEDITVDPADNIYVTGETSNCSWVSGGIMTLPVAPGNYDAFLVRLTPSGQHSWSAVVGGSSYDYGLGVASDGQGDIYITGQTSSANWATGGFDPSHNGSSDAFIAKFTRCDAITSGSLQVTLAPAGAVAAGGQWRRRGTTAWHDSGAIETGVPIGIHTIEFKFVSGWVSPAAQTLTIARGQNGQTSGTYVRGGALCVTLEPAEAVESGAQWRRAGATAWHDSGTTETEILPGDYDVEFKRIDDWAAPPNQRMAVRAAQTTVTSAVYAIPQAALDWSAYFGAYARDITSDLAVDPRTGDIYVTGKTESAGWASGGYDTTYVSQYGGDGYVAKLSSAGRLEWSAYLGSSFSDSASGVAVDHEGNVCVTGLTHSPSWDPTQALIELSASDVFVTKLSSTGQLLWCKIFGGGDTDWASAIAVDSANNIYITGETYSSYGWIGGGYDPFFNSDTSILNPASDGFVAKLSPAGERLWSTYLGGVNQDYGTAIALDGADNVCVVGKTKSPAWVSGGFRTVATGSARGFAVKLTPAGQHIWSTFLGGGIDDDATDVAIDGMDNLCIVGNTSSNWASGGYDTTLTGGDGFAVKLSPAGQHLWSTYLGGANASSVAVNSAGALYVAGKTFTPDWASGGFDESYCPIDSSGDAFVLKVTPQGRFGWSTYLGAEYLDCATGLAIAPDGAILAAGYTEKPAWLMNPNPTWSYVFNKTISFVARLSEAAPERGRGSFRVNIAPPEALAEGAQWRGAGTTTWRASGAVARNIPPGEYTLECQPTNRWALPEGVPVRVEEGQTTTVTALYKRKTGRLCVTITPPEAVALGVKWRRVGTTAWLDSGATETGITTGNWTIEFSDVPAWREIPGWTGPGTKEYSVSYQALTNVTYNYPCPVGALKVTLLPPEAASARASWRRVGSSAYKLSGVTETGVPIGEYEIEYGALNGWAPPAPEHITVNLNQTAQTTATYVRQTGSLTVTLTPPEAAAAGARWRRVGTTNWMESGGTDTNLPTGSYAIEFKPVAGWMQPGQAYVTVKPDAITSATGAYVFRTGSLKVSITPPEAAAAGAKWRRVGSSAWLDSDAVETNIPEGSWQVEFLAIPQWVKPANTTVSVYYNYTSQLPSAYIQAIGGLMVIINPPEAVAAGAQWRLLNAASWNNSGFLQTNIPMGDATIEFKAIPDWDPAPNQTCLVKAGWNALTSATYARQTGALSLTIKPPEAVAAGAQWRRVGSTAWLDSGASESGIPTGIQTVEFKPVADWSAPSPQGVAISNNRTTTKSMSYVRHTGSLRVSLTGNITDQFAGAQWRRIGETAWRDANTVESGVPTGSYEVEFKEIPDWTRPVNQIVTILRGQTTALSGLYVRQTGSLYVAIAPAGAVSEGARWRRVGSTAWLASDTTETNVPTGAWDVELQTIANWTPQGAMPVAVEYNRATTASMSYTRQTGALRMTLTPSAAVANGAGWRLSGTSPWLASGDTATSIPTGNATVEFEPIPYWAAPAPRIVSVVRDQMVTTTAAYGPLGDLSALITPSAAMAAGAQWRRVGTTEWRNSGSTETVAAQTL